jgi:hypothetical protein
MEGLLATVLNDLEMGQEARKDEMPDAYTKIAEVIGKGRAMLMGESFPFRVHVDDPAGHSFIAPDVKDGVGKWRKRDYLRTPGQNAALGLVDFEGSSERTCHVSTRFHCGGSWPGGTVEPRSPETIDPVGEADRRREGDGNCYTGLTLWLHGPGTLATRAWHLHGPDFYH